MSIFKSVLLGVAATVFLQWHWLQGFAIAK